MDCVNKIAHYLFEDSKIGKKMACARIRAELIVKEMLGTFFGNDIVIIKFKFMALQLRRARNVIVNYF